MLFLIEADEHLFDKNIGKHINYPEESLNAYKRTNERLKQLKKDNPDKKIGVIGLGDLEHKGWSDREFRLNARKLILERKELTNDNSYELKGDHSISSYGISEYDYFVGSKDIKPSENLKIDDVNIYMVDRNKEPKEVIKDVDGKLNIVLIHNHVQWENSPLRNYGSDYIKLDDNKDFKGIDYIIAGHIHINKRFNGKLVDGKKCEVIYPGCATRIKTDENYDQCSWVIIDTEAKTVVEEKYDLPPYKEVFNEIEIQVEQQKKQVKEKVTIKDILIKLDDYKIDNGGIKDYIRNMSDVDEKIKNKALEYIEKGEKNEK